MKITTGLYKGRILKCPPGRIRPVTSRMRVSLFARLGNLHGKSFLDLFSGSGIMAIEALSRQAERVVLVESDRKKFRVLQENCAGYGRDTLTIYRGAVERFLQQWKEQFSIIFADPPFAYRKKNILIEQIMQSSLVRKGSIIIIHYPKKEIITKKSAISNITLDFGGSTVAIYSV